MNDKMPKLDHEAYREFERKMELFENGPTTTIFEQLSARGIHVRPPQTVSDAEIKTRLWELLGGLASLRVQFDHTDHLNDRQLYDTLWNDVLQSEVPAVNELGFAECFSLLPWDGEEPRTSLFLRYFAAEKERDWWQKDNPEYSMPPHEAPPFNRDVLLPSFDGYPEASAWIDANWNARAVASNRFGNSAHARAFVEELYAAGAISVAVDNIVMLPGQDFAPYSDTLIVALPDDEQARRAVVECIHGSGRPSKVADVKKPYLAKGPDCIKLMWE
jgi:hypothetical protein